jgi:hypothetical protein
MSLASKLSQVMSKASYVQKRGTNQAQNYKFAMESDFLDAVRPVLVELGVVMLPSYEILESKDLTSAAGKPVHRITLSGTFTFKDVETGEELQVVTIGQGTDNQDKAAYKAMTGCLKYALRQMNLTATGDDPEEDIKLEKEEKEYEDFLASTRKLCEKVGGPAYKAVLAHLGHPTLPLKDLIPTLDTDQRLALVIALKAHDAK